MSAFAINSSYAAQTKERQIAVQARKQNPADFHNCVSKGKTVQFSSYSSDRRNPVDMSSGISVLALRQVIKTVPELEVEVISALDEYERHYDDPQWNEKPLLFLKGAPEELLVKQRLFFAIVDELQPADVRALLAWGLARALPEGPEYEPAREFYKKVSPVYFSLVEARLIEDPIDYWDASALQEEIDAIQPDLPAISPTTKSEITAAMKNYPVTYTEELDCPKN